MYENKEEIEKVILFAVDLDNGEQVPANLDELELSLIHISEPTRH